MTLFPIVERELRVASRRKATYWMRFLLAAGVFAIWFLLLLMAPGAARVARGQLLFAALSGLMLAFCFLAGAFLTADSVSQERREGTLGLLFLTDLKGYEVALGKLLATSLHAFYGLLAVLPLLAYSLLIGGVTPGEFWRMSLALTLTLTLSLCVGLLVSVHSRETRQAMGGCLVTLILIGAGPPVVSGLARLIFKGPWPQILGWPSPLCAFGYAFEASFRSGMANFWGSIVMTAVLIVVALAVAGVGAAAVWREKGEETPKSEAAVVWRGLRFPERLSAGRVELLEADPYCWLATRDRLPRLVAMSWLGTGLIVWLILVGLALTYPVALGAAMVITYLVHLSLKWLVTIEASRRFSEDRHNGTLELILVSPLSIEAVVQGQSRALRKMFRLPFIAAALMNGLLFLEVCASVQRLGMEEAVGLSELLICGTALLFVDFSALGWVGMWMGMVTKRHNRAVLATLARIMLVPWVANFFLILLTVGGAGLGLGTAQVLAPLWFGLAAVLEWTFRARAKIGLYAALRQVAGDTTLKPGHPAFLDEAAQLSAASSQAV